MEMVDAPQRMHKYISLNIQFMPLYSYGFVNASVEGNCKPSSVVSHIGWATTIYLVLSLPIRSSGQPRSGSEPYRPLLGLAPDGVCLDRNCYQLRGELLPHLFTLTALQRFVSVALSVGSPRPAVNGHPSEWSSDFPLGVFTPSGRPFPSNLALFYHF